MRYVTYPSHLASELKFLGNFDPANVASARKDVLRLREYWRGDFTALTPVSDKKDALIAYTLHLPEEDRGAVLVFRREEAPVSFVVKLPEINLDKTYCLTLSDENLVETTAVVTGSALSEGYSVKITEAPGSLLLLYKAI